MHYSTVHLYIPTCGASQYSTPLYPYVWYITVQYTSIPLRVVHHSTVHLYTPTCGASQYSTPLYPYVWCITVQYTSIPLRVVHHSTVQLYTPTHIYLHRLDIPVDRPLHIVRDYPKYAWDQLWCLCIRMWMYSTGHVRTDLHILYLESLVKTSPPPYLRTSYTHQSSKMQPDIGHFPIIFSKCPDVINFVRILCLVKGSVYGYRRLSLFRWQVCGLSLSAINQVVAP